MSLLFPFQELDTLNPADIAVAELKALVGKGKMTKDAFREIVLASGAPTVDGGPWSAQKLNESLQRLTRKRLLQGDGEIHPDWREPLALRVARRPDGAAMIAAVRAAAPKSWVERSRYRQWKDPEWYDDAALARTVWLMILANDGAGVERLIGLVEASLGGATLAVAPTLLRHTPTDLDFLDSLSPDLRDRVCSAHVERLLDHGIVDPGVAEMIAAFRDRDQDWSEWPRLDFELLRLDLLAERHEAATTRVARLNGVDPVKAIAAQATLAFLAGPPHDALLGFREALKRWRKAVGRRKIALPGDFGVYHLLALFAAGNDGLLGEISTQLEIFDESRPHLAAALYGLFLLVSGSDREAKAWADQFFGRRRTFLEGPLPRAVITLSLSVVDGANAARREDDDRRAVEAWGALAPLAARTLAEIHDRFPGPAAGAPERWRARLDALGPAPGRRLVDIVPIKPPWERALDRLQGFLAPPPVEKAEAPTRTRRLIFRLDPAVLDIEPIEQAAKGQDWSPGRAVALKRLHQRDPKIDYLTAEDQAVLQTIKLEKTYYNEAYSFDRVRGPLALIGHPRVFDASAPERRIDLVAYPVELIVREKGHRLRIELSHRAAEPTVLVEPETPTRWRVIEVTPALVELAATLGPEGLDVPREARERVIALVKTDNPRLPVRSELRGVATDAIAGDSRPILRIAPEGGGFHIHALVRPVGETGPAYAPGVGARSVLAPADGGHRRINRDLSAESAALEAVVEACPALASWRESDHDWRIEELDAALEALQQLHEFSGPLGLEWPEGARLAPTRTVGSGGLNLTIASARDWFEVKGEIRVDEDLVLDMADVLARLSRSHGRFVPLDDGRYLALTEDLRRRLDAFAAVTEQVKSGRRIGVAGVAAVEDLVESAGSVKTDKRWSELIARMAAARGYEPALPAGLDADLRDYQVQGFTWLARLSRLGLGACLADDMGLGKTVQTLALLLNDAGRGPSLVVAPTSVCHNWALEAERFAPDLKVRMLSTAPDRKGLVESLGPADLLVVSYGLLHTESDLLASRRFAVAVFDEAQNLKNAETRRAQASKRIDADFRLALTGTPIENRLEELWSLYDTVTPGLLGSRESFHKRFSGPMERGQGGHARAALRALVRPYLLRRTKAAVLAELPPRTEITVAIEPGAEERAFYEALRRRALQTLQQGGGAGGQKRIRILAEITRLRRAACNPALIEPEAGLESAKLTRLLDLAAELRANRHRALVFSQFTGHLDLVEAALKQAGVRLLRLDGSTPAKERARLVEAFQAGEGELFLISLKAGGTGLNLTGADYVIHLDPWWNPAVEDQATDRAHRIGQTRPVTVYRLVIAGSIEEKILALHAAKRTLSADFLEDAEAAGTLGEDELMALIAG